MGTFLFNLNMLFLFQREDFIYASIYIYRKGSVNAFGHCINIMKLIRSYQAIQIHMSFPRVRLAALSFIFKLQTAWSWKKKKISSHWAESCRVMKNCRGGKDSHLLFINSDFDRARENRDIWSEGPFPEDSSRILVLTPSLSIGSRLSALTAHWPISQKLSFKKPRFVVLKSPWLELPTGRERHQRRLWCNTFKMGNYDLLKYSPYAECMTIAYSAGKKSGQSPAEISITEKGTCTARAELIKRPNPNQNQPILGWGRCLTGIWGVTKGSTLVPGLC